MDNKTQTLSSTEQENKTIDLVNARKNALAELKSNSAEGNFAWLNENSRKFLASG